MQSGDLSLPEVIVPVLYPRRLVEAKGQGARRTVNDFSVPFAIGIRMRDANDLRAFRKPPAFFREGGDLVFAHPAGERSVAGMRGREQRSVREAINRALADDELRIAVKVCRTPKAFAAKIGETLEEPVSFFKSAHAGFVFVRKNHVRAAIDFDAAFEARGEEHGSRQGALLLQPVMPV